MELAFAQTDRVNAPRHRRSEALRLKLTRAGHVDWHVQTARRPDMDNSYVSIEGADVKRL